MQYRFYKWRARKPGSSDWRELGWCMTEEDARNWAEKHGHQIEPLPGTIDKPSNEYGNRLN